MIKYFHLFLFLADFLLRNRNICKNNCNYCKIEKHEDISIFLYQYVF